MKRSFSGPGIQGSDQMERRARYLRCRITNLSLLRARGSKQAHRVQKEDDIMATYHLSTNGSRKTVYVDPSTPLLWVLREELKLTGTKYGCGVSACGACTVHVAGVATRSCMLPVLLVGERAVVTSEAMGA